MRIGKAGTDITTILEKTLAPDVHCAPGIDPITINDKKSCLSKEKLKIIAEHVGANNSGNYEEIWARIDQKLKSCDGNDVCWTEKLKSNDAIDEINRESFKPERPKGERQWLSNIDIADVMGQYERLYDNFVFYGPVSSDLYDGNLKHQFNVPSTHHDFVHGNKPRNAISPDIPKNIIGITFNTDPHYKGGAHWVTLVIKIEKKIASFYYFDSVGKYPNRNISLSIHDIVKMFKRSKCYSKINLYVNRTEHQKKNTECGVYSLNFLLKMLNGESFDDIVNNVVRDDIVASTRQLIFRRGS